MRERVYIFGKNFFKNIFTTGRMFRVGKGFPEDAEIKEIFYCEHFNYIKVRVTHESFDVVKLDEITPKVCIKIEEINNWI